MKKLMISSIQKFNDDGVIREGLVHGKYKNNSFIVIVKDFETNEETDYIVNIDNFIDDIKINTK
jgi:hypothetical protein